jgi:phage FluMu protein Com
MGECSMNAKCPKCEQIITNVDLELGPVGNSVTGPLASGYVAICPRCRTVLGVMPDLDSIVKKVLEKLTGQKGR